MVRLFLKTAIGALAGLFAAGALASAKTVDFCNASPVKITSAVAYYDRTLTLASRGWFVLEPGACATLTGVAGGQLYYYAYSATPLAKWLVRKPAMTWEGPTRFCINPDDAFRLPDKTECATKAGFLSQSLYGPRPMAPIFEKNHLGIRVSDAPALARDLRGVMAFEQRLKDTPGREPAFQLGADFTDAPQGPRVDAIHPGLPAEYEGMQVGDIILNIDGAAVQSVRDLNDRLDALPFDRIYPLQISLLRNGQTVRGRIMPMWFAFNHPLYDQVSPSDVFWWDFADGMALDFGNEFACGVGAAAAETSRSTKTKRDFRLNNAIGKSASCAAQKNRKQKLYRLFYEDAAIAGSWASIIGAGGAFKLARGARSASLASKPHLVRRPPPKYRSFK